MYAEEETELRDLVIQNLESCGFLNKIKAELRAGVFLALEEESNLKTKIPIVNKKIDNFVNTAEGKIVISVVREFLEYFDLNFSLSVFDPEVASPTPYITRSDLCERLKLRNNEIQGPVISALLKSDMIADTINLNDASSLHASNADFSLKSDFGKSSTTQPASVRERNIAGSVLIKEQSIDSDDLRKENVLVIDSSKTIEDLAVKENSSLSDTRKEKPDVKDPFARSELYGKNGLGKDKHDVTDILKNDKSSSSNMFKEPKVSSLDHDPFFDEPLPSEKTSFFSFPTENKITSGNSKDRNESKLHSSFKNDPSNADKQHSLSSLRDLPSLTTSNEWTFTRDPKNSLPSLDSLKSVSSSENSNDEMINLDPRSGSDKKDSDVNESNEDSSDKQIHSEESIEEEIEEDFSGGIDDLLNSSLSLADDVTTDQTISQVSVVEGVDHIEPCTS